MSTLRNARILVAAIVLVACGDGTAPVFSVSGAWTGVLHSGTPNGPQVLPSPYVLTLTHTDSEVSGTARISVPGEPVYFAVYSISGTVTSARRVQFATTGITSQNPPPGGIWCPQITADLQYFGGPPARLSGIFTAPAQCQPSLGAIVVEKN